MRSEIKSYVNIKLKCIIGLYPIIFEFNPIRIQFNIWLDGVGFGSDFQMQLLIGLNLDVYRYNTNLTYCYPYTKLVGVKKIIWKGENYVHLN